jgi:hypothetical protein
MDVLSSGGRPFMADLSRLSFTVFRLEVVLGGCLLVAVLWMLSFAGCPFGGCSWLVVL